MTNAPTPEPRGSVFFAILDNGGGNYRAGFVGSLIALLASGCAGWPMKFAQLGDSHAGRARNRAAADFLASDCEWLLFIDADIRFSPQHIAELMESRAQIQCGIYFKKGDGIQPCLCPHVGQQKLDRSLNQSVARAGTGFMRIHRSVFERLKEQNGGPAEHYTNHGRDEWDFFKSGVANKEWLSEDWYFCDMARAVGIPTMVDGRVQVEHEGNVFYPLPTAVAAAQAANAPAPTPEQAAA